MKQSEMGGAMIGTATLSPQDPQRDPMADPRRERLASEKPAREVSRLLEILDNLECEQPRRKGGRR